MARRSSDREAIEAEIDRVRSLGLEGQTNWMFYSSRSLMTNSAMIQTANTSNGWDVCIASVLFREFLMIGKREISALEMVGCTYFNSSYHPTSLIRDYRNSSSVVVLCSAFLAATLTVSTA